MIGPCLVCGAPGDDRHHPTGRGPDGRYLDRQFTAAGCHDHHELWHDDLRSVGIDGPAGGLTVLERFELRLRRLALLLGRLEGAGALHRLLRVLADVCVRWADELRAEIGRLDRAVPAWRTAGASDGT